MKYILIGGLLGALAIVSSDVFHKEDLQNSVDGLNMVYKQLVEVGSGFDQQVKQVDTMPESGIFTAVWVEDGFFKIRRFLF